MALAAQALEAQKASKPLEQGGALERVAARIKRVMGLTTNSAAPKASAGMTGYVSTRPPRLLKTKECCSSVNKSPI